VPPRIAAAARSERGARDANEDAACVLRDGARWLAVLADGAGGHRDGADASRRALAQVEAALNRAPADFEAASLTRAVLGAHAAVRAGRAAAGMEAGGGMHATLVALWIDETRGALWSHVGDSRLYRAHDGRVEQLTADDSVVQRLVDAGLLTPGQAATHPRRNELVAALGIAEELEPHTLARPVAVEEGDAFLLCSDGWWHELGDDCLAGTLAQARSPDDWLDAMHRAIVARARPRQDNFSAVAVWIGDAGEVTRPRMKAMPARA